MTENTAYFQSHQYLCTVLEYTLTPVEIEVSMELELLSRPPKADILLLRREGKAWNASQRARLPDGVRDSAANHVLIEFKYTESVNTTALRQAIVYDHLYRQAQKLPEGALLTIVLSAKTPRKDSLDSWAYSEVKDGVFRSSNPFLENVMLLVLNGLPPTPHNATVKLFASRKKVRETAFATLDRSMIAETPGLELFLVGLHKAMGLKGETEMAEVLTTEKLMEIGEKVRTRILELATPEEILAGLDHEERQELLRLLQDEMGAGAKDQAAGNGGAS